MRERRLGVLVLAAVSMAQIECSDKSPAGPSAVTASASPAASGPVKAQNAPPNLAVRTTPAADYSTNPPTITVSGTPPLSVFFGLCQSDDPDAGDTLNWQYNFGDSGRAAFNADGTFNADAEHVCRADHEYREGTYTAWVSVTDKHLEDQSRGVHALARKSQAFRVRVVRGVSLTCGGVSVSTGFEGVAPTTPVESLAVPGVSFNGGGGFVVIDLPPGTPLPPFTGNVVVGILAPSLTMNFETDQSAYSFPYLTLGDPLTVQGFDDKGNSVFTHTFPGPVGLPLGASGSGTFHRLVLSTPSGVLAIDNLTTTACQ